MFLTFFDRAVKQGLALEAKSKEAKDLYLLYNTHMYIYIHTHFYFFNLKHPRSWEDGCGSKMDARSPAEDRGHCFSLGELS